MKLVQRNTTAGLADAAPGFVQALALFSVVLFLTSCSSGNEGPGVLPKAMGAADETSTIQTLRTIATAQGQLKAARGVYGDFDTLVQAGLLDERFTGSTPNLKGYRFAIRVTDSDFAVNADPQTTDKQPTTGSRHFYLDSAENAIHVNATQAATKDDPML